MKILDVDVGAAIVRGFNPGFVPGLVSSLVAYFVRTEWMEAPISWESVSMLRDIVLKSFSVAMLVSLIAAVFVFIWRLAKAHP